MNARPRQFEVDRIPNSATPKSTNTMDIWRSRVRAGAALQSPALPAQNPFVLDQGADTQDDDAPLDMKVAEQSESVLESLGLGDSDLEVAMQDPETQMSGLMDALDMNERVSWAEVEAAVAEMSTLLATEAMSDSFVALTVSDGKPSAESSLPSTKRKRSPEESPFGKKRRAV